MSKMIFRHGKDKTWKGVAYDWKIISEEEIQGYLDAGWFTHPDDLLNNSEDPEPEPEVKERKKPGTKQKG